VSFPREKFTDPPIHAQVELPVKGYVTFVDAWGASVNVSVRALSDTTVLSKILFNEDGRLQLQEGDPRD